jgi:hypothetical protein
MITALGDQVDASPPLYYALTWLWVRLVGTNENLIRLLSSVWICISFLVTWQVLRRRYGFWPSSIACAACFGLSNEILYQNCEARSYSLLLGVGALCIMQFDKMLRKRRCSWQDCALNAVLHSAMIYTHLYGFMYSIAFFAAATMHDFLQRPLKLKYPLSIVAGWASLIFWFRAFLRQADLGKPRLWIVEPTLRKLFASLDCGIELVLILVLLFVASIVFSQFRTQKERDMPPPVDAATNEKCHAEVHLSILGACLVLVAPVLSWLYSKLFTPVFHIRYMILGTLGWAIIFTILSIELFGLNTKITSKKAKLVLAILVSCFIFLPVSYPFIRGQWRENRPASIEAMGYAKLPIVIESALTYLPLFHYSEQRESYYFILDWEAALDERGSPVAVADFKVMNAMKRHYVFPNAVEHHGFLKQHNRFLVYDEKDRVWFESRIKTNSKYNWTDLGNDLVLVERLG